MHHFLKVHAQIYPRVKSGEKRFEIRKDDRCYQTGDYVTMMIHPEDGAQSPVTFRIGFILRGGQYGLEHGYVAFQLEDVPVDASGVADCADEERLPLRTPDGWTQHNGGKTPAAVRGLSSLEVRYRNGAEETVTSTQISALIWSWFGHATTPFDIMAYRYRDMTGRPFTVPEYPQEWQEHHGKSIPEWVRPNFCVDIRLRDGTEFRENFPNGLTWVWNAIRDMPQNRDIVAYKIV
jgi:hypothetical protein